MYNYALTTELYDGKNPTRTMVLSRFDNKKTNVLTDEQRSSLLTVLNAWENRLPALALHMCLVTGKRTGEIFGLRWTDIDFERNTMSFLVKSLKVGERQVLPMSKAVRSILEEAKQHQHIKNCPLVFPNSNGDKIEYTSIWQRIRKKQDCQRISGRTTCGIPLPPCWPPQVKSTYSPFKSCSATKPPK